MENEKYRNGAPKPSKKDWEKDSSRFSQMGFTFGVIFLMVIRLIGGNTFSQDLLMLLMASLMFNSVTRYVRYKESGMILLSAVLSTLAFLVTAVTTMMEYGIL